VVLGRIRVFRRVFGRVSSRWREFGGGQDEADPLINEGAQALVIAELLLHGRETLTPDKLAAAFPLPGITNLVIGSVFLGLGLAAAPAAWRRI
jgi:hypothetical protein